MILPPDRTALLVIDMQNDFVEESAVFEIPGIRDGIPALSRFIDEMRERGLPVFFTRHTYDPNDNVIETALFPNLADGGLREGTHGWDVCEALTPAESDVVINKPRYDAFYRTSLDEELKSRGVTHLLITGTMTEICCESTARSAMMRDYRVVVVSDLCFTRDPEKHEASLRVLGSHFGWVHPSSDVRAMVS